MSMDIDKLVVEDIEIRPTRNLAGYLVVSLNGVDANDLLACMSEVLLSQFIEAIGEDTFREHFGYDK